MKKRIEKEDERDTLVGQIKVDETQLQGMDAQQQQLEPLLNQLTAEDKEQLLQFQQRHSAVFSEINLDNIQTRYEQLKEQIEQRAHRIEESVNREGRELDRSINKIKNPPMEILQKFTDWAADVQQLEQ